MLRRTYFDKPDHGTVDVGSLVWYYNSVVLIGPLHVVEIRHSGYGNGAHKKWILFDTCKNEYRPATFDQLRIPKECVQ